MCVYMHTGDQVDGYPPARTKTNKFGNNGSATLVNAIN